MECQVQMIPNTLLSLRMPHWVCASVRPAVWQSLAPLQINRPLNKTALPFNDQLDSRGNQHSVKITSMFTTLNSRFTLLLPLLLPQIFFQCWKKKTPDWETSLSRCRPTGGPKDRNGGPQRLTLTNDQPRSVSWGSTSRPSISCRGARDGPWNPFPYEDNDGNSNYC